MVNIVYKYVLAGGPGAGKTDGINYLSKILNERSYKIFTIQETASELINSGLDRNEASFPYYNFSLMLYKELLYQKMAKNLHQDAVILCDRGRMDPKAYRGNEVFENILGHYSNMTEKTVLNSYDGVLLLETAANGYEENYQQTDIRIETPETARSIQKRIEDVWSKHNNVIYIPAMLDFDKKLEYMENQLIQNMEVLKQRKSLTQTQSFKDRLIEYANTINIPDEKLFYIVRTMLAELNESLIDREDRF